MSTPPPQRQSFPGFPAGARATAVPSVFFSQLLPQIDDAAELRVTLYVIYALGRRKGYPRFVTEGELAAAAPLLAALEHDAKPPPPEPPGAVGEPLASGAKERLRRGLDAAVRRGSLLCQEVEQDGRRETLYFLNAPADRRALSLVQQGRLPLGRALPLAAEAPAQQQENVFQLYEENIGPLTPLIAEELREAEGLYPFEWLEEALREAALLNKRSWRYVARILQRWATEGRRRETAGRDHGAADTARAQFIRRYRGLRGG